MEKNLINKCVEVRLTKKRGIIKSISGNIVTVEFPDSVAKFSYPAAFANTLTLEDWDAQRALEEESSAHSFDFFKRKYLAAIHSEIRFLKTTGGKKYRAIDGMRIEVGETFIYSFDTDADFHFPTGTDIKIWFPEKIVTAQILSCEEFMILLQVNENIGEKIDLIEFTAEPWQLMEGLYKRIEELNPTNSPLAYILASQGKYQINPRKSIVLGQDAALKRAASQPITFIWGPPGTGKTTTLSKIALEYIHNNKRVLMLSYSNVAVDGALLKIAEQSDHNPGIIVRYGYPRVKELLESDYLTSYAYVLSKNPKLEKRYKELEEEKKRTKKTDIRRRKINEEMNTIRSRLLQEERELVHKASLVATTVSKAILDKAIYEQKFDLVIFDEASMAYVPQIIFAASLAKTNFCCLGDFRQLPAIVQNNEDQTLTRDIFEYTGITAAVENGSCHDWLVMLNVQYRMHPDISDFVSRHMYENLLRSAEGIFESRQAIANCGPMEGAPMGIVDLSSSYSVCIQTIDKSRINLMSALVSMRLAEILAKKYDVAIITPYSAQSRLIMAMIRDLQERNSEVYGKLTCATVHQFQGSEKSIVIFDAVDCYRMPYPGALLTSKRNHTADRLFNVALTRAQGKFILVANTGYLLKKRISEELLFTKALRLIDESLQGEAIFNELGTLEGELTDVFLGDRDEVDSWKRYLTDLKNANKEIWIDVPGAIDDDIDALDDLKAVLEGAKGKKIDITVRFEECLHLPTALRPYSKADNYITTPFTVIDKKIVWFGEPLSSADFICEGYWVRSGLFPCLRFEGRRTARILKAIF